MYSNILKTDYLVIGSGVAGLSYGLELAKLQPEKEIWIYTKTKDRESNTRYAQGGIAAVLDQNQDSIALHVADTLKAGGGLCNLETVRLVVQESSHSVRKMIAMGTDFDKKPSGELDLVREGGHSANRIAHYKDVTGHEILRALFEQLSQYPNLKLVNNHFVIDLVVKDGVCRGIYTFNYESQAINRVFARTTLLATGGIGQVYAYTTNPDIATGDGIAMAERAGVKIKDMAFVQFHPTVLYSQKQGRNFLISEAVRGHGAILRNQADEAFMIKYDSRKELASRDIVARAINQELQERQEQYVYLDCTHLEQTNFIAHFPNIYQKCVSLKIDLKQDYIPVVPAAHYICGGIETNLKGETNIQNLYACGEVACTGLHGANRLASNSLLEAAVFGKICAEQQIANQSYTTPFQNSQNLLPFQFTPVEQSFVEKIQSQLQNLMVDKVSILRSTKTLSEVQTQVNQLQKELDQDYPNSIFNPSLQETRNLIAVAQLIIADSLDQKENRGSFFNTDFQ